MASKNCPGPRMGWPVDPHSSWSPHRVSGEEVSPDTEGAISQREDSSWQNNCQKSSGPR